MKPIPLFAALLALTCAPASAQTNEVVPRRPAAVDAAEQAIMSRIERDIRLPRGASPLTAYDRYYAWHQDADGVRTVVAIYVGGNGGRGGRRWVAEADLPGIDDGGCSVVSFSYDLGTQRFDQLGCNGYG